MKFIKVLDFEKMDKCFFSFPDILFLPFTISIRQEWDLKYIMNADSQNIYIYVYRNVYNNIL